MSYYMSESGRWVIGVAATPGDTITLKAHKRYSDVALYYANIIDYVRSLMTIIAIILITIDSSSYSYAIAFLIMGSVLLDWIDGPVARYFGQSTVIGCGFDWLADILAQYALALWCLKADINVFVCAFVVVFTTIEIACGIFDFAVSATCVYPAQTSTSSLPWYLFVEHWLTPDQTYSWLGTLSWLINTAYPIAHCFKFPMFICHIMVPCAFLYAWHECCQLYFILDRWMEMTASLRQGIDFVRPCKEDEKTLLCNTWDQVKLHISKPNKDEKTSKTDIKWINIFNNGKMDIEFELRASFDKWVGNLVNQNYGLSRVILSYGFINNPVNSNSQAWHFDYAPTVSNLFINLTPLTHHNSSQFVRGALIHTRMPSSQYFPEPYQLLESEKVPFFEICQTVCPPFSILKLFPSVVHRGISNTGTDDRVIFFVSTNDVNLDIGEDVYYSAKAENEVYSEMTTKKHQ